MDAGIRVEVTGVDEDSMRLSVRCSNGRYCCAVDAYVSHFAGSGLAETLRRFARSPGDESMIKLGAPSAERDEDGLELRFRSIDGVGHCVVAVDAHSETYSPGHYGVESAAFIVPVEAAAIDRFVSELDQMTATPGARAWLAGSI